MSEETDFTFYEVEETTTPTNRTDSSFMSDESFSLSGCSIYSESTDMEYTPYIPSRDEAEITDYVEHMLKISQKYISKTHYARKFSYNVTKRIEHLSFISELCTRHKYDVSTIELAVYLYNNVLDRCKHDIFSFKTLCIACFVIAGKYNEDECPLFWETISTGFNIFGRYERMPQKKEMSFAALERCILEYVDFELTIASPYTILSVVMGLMETDENENELIKLMSQICVLNYDQKFEDPSVNALACLACTRILSGGDVLEMIKVINVLNVEIDRMTQSVWSMLDFIKNLTTDFYALQAQGITHLNQSSPTYHHWLGTVSKILRIFKVSNMDACAVVKNLNHALKLHATQHEQLLTE